MTTGITGEGGIGPRNGPGSGAPDGPWAPEDAPGAGRRVLGAGDEAARAPARTLRVGPRHRTGTGRRG